MQKKSLFSTLVISAMAASAIMFSGCSQSSPSTPVAKVNKTFKTPLSNAAFGEALKKAASMKEWKVASADSTTYRLQKSYTKTHPEILEAEVTHYNVYVNVTLDNNVLTIEPLASTVDTLSDHGSKHEFNSDLASLEKAIYVELIPHVM